MYEIIFSKPATKFTKNLPHSYRNKIKKILEILQENPFGYPYKKIKGEADIYRIRVGKYRILYEINQDNNRIIILKIDKRSHVYDR